jgi:glycogen debranching enzyme
MVHSSRACYALCICLATFALFPPDSSPFQQTKPTTPGVKKFVIADSPIQFSQPVRRGKYMESAGRRAVLMGREEGMFESWIYPMKVVHNLRLEFTVDGYSYPLSAADLAEWITVRPECTTITYSHPAFIVRAHMFTPIEEPGSLILLDISSNRKVSITANFLIDLLPMWPGGLGGQYSYWDDDLKAFVLSESLRKHSAIIGSPAATRYSSQPAHNLPDAPTQFHIDVDPEYARQNFIPIAIAGGLDAATKIQVSYLHLLTDAKSLYDRNVQHFSSIRNDFLQLKSPDADINRAVEWAKIALDTGFVCNPQLGCGQVAGLGLSGTSTRPGFGWYFGGDTFINSFAVSSMGDFATLKQELTFLRGNQRADGKMMHELSQAGAMLPWFTQFPYAYYHGDTTPLYLIAMENYFQHTGDKAFLQQSWDSLKKAYEYCLSTDADNDGLMNNSKAGLAAVETGTLLNRLATDVFLAGVSVQAHQAMRRMASVLEAGDTAAQAQAGFDKGLASLNRQFWNPDRKILSFALTEGGGRSDELTVWPAVPILFRLIDPEHAAQMLDQLASAEISSDWGARMLTNTSKLYDPISYNNGAIWPFLTGLLSWAEFGNHRMISGFSHWIQNARLTSMNALGYVPELLSGDFYAPMDAAVPHQLFSSSGVLTPLVKGMLGFYPAAYEKSIRLEPHLPCRWGLVTINNLKVGSGSLDLQRTRSREEAVFRIPSSGLAGFKLELSPGFEPGALVRKVSVNGKPVPHTETYGEDVHCRIEFQLTGSDVIVFELTPGLQILEPMTAPIPGDRNKQLKILHVSWERERDRYTMDLEGLGGSSYSLQMRMPRKPAKVEGARWEGLEVDGVMTIEFPAASQGYVRRTVILQMTNQ